MGAPRPSGSSERLIDGVHDLCGLEFIEARAAAADMAFATFEGTRHAWQGILDDPDIAAVLDRAAGGPGLGEPADWPRAPDAGVHRAEQCDRRASSCGGEMRRRCVGTDINPRLCQQVHRLRPFQLMDFGHATPDVFKIVALSFAGTADRND